MVTIGCVRFEHPHLDMCNSWTAHFLHAFDAASVRFVQSQSHFECASELTEDRPLRLVGSHLEGHQVIGTADDV